MRYVFIIIILLAIPILAPAATLKVPSQYPTIQDAINAASGGDTVKVAPGTYVENIDFKGKAITVKSIGGAGMTVIDGNDAGSVVTFNSSERSSSVLNGFTLTNGTRTYFERDRGSRTHYGGGIYCYDSFPTIKNNTISGNSAWDGGGIYCKLSSPVITNNTITGNSVDYNGGGIYCCLYSSPVITNNTISDNKSSGIYCYFYSSPVIRNNTISGNKSSGIYCYNSSPIITDNTVSGNSGGVGGAISCDSSSPIITNNTISGNTDAQYGGGIYCYSSSPAITNNTITGNSVSYHGGGICCIFSSFPTIINNTISGNATGTSGGGIHCRKISFPTITNNTISGNTAAQNGGGIHCRDNAFPTITNNTISGNAAVQNGGGICCIYNSSPSIINTILWNNSAFSGPEIWIGDTSKPSTLAISYSVVKGWKSSVYVKPGCTLIWGAGMIGKNPLFVDVAEGDFHLTYNSPCRESGSIWVPNLPQVDFEGDPRIAYGTVDMGADEFYKHLYWTGEARPGGDVKIKIVGLPGTSPVGLCIGTDVLDPPLKSKWGDWYLALPIIGPIDLGSITSPEGVLIVSGTIPGSPPPPYSIPMQALIGAELTNLSLMEVK